MRLNLFLKRYVLIISLLMAAQALFFIFSDLMNWNFFLWAKNNYQSNYEIISGFIGYLFLFGVINILIIGCLGVYLIVGKHNFKIGILGILTALLYLYYAANYYY